MFNMAAVVGDSGKMNENWLVMRARACGKADPYSAKAWLITARTLYPHNFIIQFEAYIMEKNGQNVPEAAGYLQQMLHKFPEEPKLMSEVQTISEALQSESTDTNTQLYRDLFSALPASLQREMLLKVVSQRQDVLEQCKTTMLILKRFPDLVPETGIKLIETLLSTEKHAHFHTAINCYRKYLVHDVFPVVLNCHEVDVSHKVLHKWLQKAIEFYICYITQAPSQDSSTVASTSQELMSPTKKLSMSFSGVSLKRQGSIPGLPDKDSHIPKPWASLENLMAILAPKLGWELEDFFSKPNIESKWQDILQFHQKAQRTDSSTLHRQVMYLSSLLLFESIFEYEKLMDPEQFASSCGSHQPTCILIEGLKSKHEEHKTGPKHKKLKVDTSQPQLMVNPNIPDSDKIIQHFTTALKFWELVHSGGIEKDFKKLCNHMRVENWSWVKRFENDILLYQGHFREAISALQTHRKTAKLQTELQLASCYFSQGSLTKCCEMVLNVILGLAEVTDSQAHQALPQFTGRGRYMQTIQLTNTELLPYCVEMLLACFKEKAFSHHSDDMPLGHMIVLVQYDWPKHETLFLQAMDQIKQQGCFTYNTFFSYVINIDILEEFAFLKSQDGGKINLDILPQSAKLLAQQRTVTRGVQKGAKEDFKTTLEKQVSRSSENLETLIRQFLTTERTVLIDNLQ